MLLAGHPARKETILKRTYEEAVALAQAAAGPLSAHLGTFVVWLIEQDYSIWCVHLKARRALDFDRWLADEGVELVELADAHITRYQHDRSRPGCTGRVKNWRNELRALRHLLHFLRSRGLCSVVPVQTLPADEVVAAFDRYLQCERGLAAGTIGYYRSFSRQFLAERFGKGLVDLGALRANDVVDFVQRQAARMAPRAVKLVITALRAFLRYAQYRGEVGPHLVAAVPAVAAWSTTPSLPRAIAPEHARRAIESCSPHTAVGRRDRAVLLLLARLGLRSGEIRSLMLDDVDWDTGGLRVRGKGRRECLLPLPDEVGQAIAAYLRDGRPVSADRHLFLRARAPIRGLMPGADGIGSIVKHALVRTGIDTPHRGSHQFRHALAVQMLQRGASLPEIGDLLRHRSPQTTTIYARADLVALRALALPWPGSPA